MTDKEKNNNRPNTSKLRILYLYRILEEKTDENHVLSTNQLIKALDDQYGISSHRTTITTDIKLLKQYGFDIGVIESTQNKYYLASREFETAEVKLLIDAVASSKFITEKKSKDLIKKLGTLINPYDAKDIKRHTTPDDRIKTRNEAVIYNVDALNVAINGKRKVSFKYFCLDENKKKQLKNDGEPYIFSPWALVWNGDNYYVVGWSKRHNDIGCFRVDRMYSTPDVLDEKAVPQVKGFSAADYIKKNYHMFGGGNICSVELTCDAGMMDAIVDRFGEDVQTTTLDDGAFAVKVDVAVNSVFFGWVFGFCGKVRIAGPRTVVQQYEEMGHQVFGALDK